MRKPILLLLLQVLAVAAFAQSEWYVQVAAFDQRVPVSYFEGFESLQYYEDQNEIHRYYTGPYMDKQSAVAERKKLVQKGFNPVLTNFDEILAKCTCASEKPLLNVITNIEHLFFEFNEASLVRESKNHLDELAEVLRTFPETSTQLLAHTDAKGSHFYNDNLSLSRAKAAKAYLVRKGIASKRIKIKGYGERMPIALNQLTNGQDTEEGRKFNRRIELKILDEYGRTISGIVREIDIPDNLRQ